MPKPQSTNVVLAPSADDEPQSDVKDKEQSTPWSRRTPGVFSQLPQQPLNPYVMVTPTSSLGSSTHLRALLHDSKQAVVIHPLSRDSVTQSPVIHLSPATSSSILNVPPAKILPVMAKHKPQSSIIQGSDLSLAWVQEKTRFGKAEVTRIKNGVASGSQHHPSSQDTETCHKKPSSDEQSKDSTEFLYPMYYGGICKFPGCEKVFADHRNFLRHLHNDHNLADKSTMQCLIQNEVVHSLEEQLAVEKKKLYEMQKQMAGKINIQTVHLPKQRERNLILHHPSVSSWPGLNVSVPFQKEFPETVLAVRQHLWEGSSINIFQDMTNCIEYYKVNCVRPPFTYASLIRWAILESPQKQLALNEIYHWFTRMFAFFRSNKITWKNAVRHNLSLHKCFVRVENIRGAVWMVDELEFQRKRGVRSSR
ncbi:forkhead box protein P3 [Pelobates fuscus]|uniref:forkhead box protein P3 n=1 Tax=Pelobates fuscus TaxID=191477 RepID=UPI002FE45936